ncbi:MAG: energy-coupling factor ABC transporter ATP-binding protein [Syntrophobacteraceae bacterium]
MIEIRDLHYTYPDGTVGLNGVSLVIADGEFLVLCGPNGSGKTTLARHLNGLLQPRSGTVLVDGCDVTRDGREAARRVGMVFQDADSQILGDTVREDVAFGPENMGCSPAEVQERVDVALKALGIEHLESKPCELLSGGEKRRVAIAGVVAMRPQAILFDEPFANLDANGVRQTLHQLVALHEKGHTVIVTTHDVEKVAVHADRLVVLQGGRLVASGPPADIAPRLGEFGLRPPCYCLLGGKPLSWLEG